MAEDKKTAKAPWWKSKFAIFGVVGIGLVIWLVAGTGGGTPAEEATPTATPLSPLQELTNRVDTLEGVVQSQSLNVENILAFNNQLEKDIEELQDTVGEDWADEIDDIMADLDKIQGDIKDINKALNGSGSSGGGGTTPPPATSSLTISLLSTTPTIVNDGVYDFTVRVANDGSSPASGTIVLQLFAYSGACDVNAIAMTGDPAFNTVDYNPIRTSAQTITIFSDQVVVASGTSKIYQFSLDLDQGGIPFEWIPVVGLAN